MKYRASGLRASAVVVGDIGEKGGNGSKPEAEEAARRTLRTKAVIAHSIHGSWRSQLCGLQRRTEAPLLEPMRDKT